MSVPEGLSAKEARIRLDKYGPNVLDSHSRNSSWVLLIRQFTSPIILILFVATIISMFLGEVIDGFIILATSSQQDYANSNEPSHGAR
jgi:Mg2+-importing ATPase